MTGPVLVLAVAVADELLGREIGLTLGALCEVQVGGDGNRWH